MKIFVHLARTCLKAFPQCFQCCCQHINAFPTILHALAIICFIIQLPRIISDSFLAAQQYVIDNSRGAAAIQSVTVATEQPETIFNYQHELTSQLLVKVQLVGVYLNYRMYWRMYNSQMDQTQACQCSNIILSRQESITIQCIMVASQFPYIELSQH